jgi:hypothetical protein
MLERTFCYIIYISQWLEGRKIITTTLNYKGELIVYRMYCVTGTYICDMAFTTPIADRE